jgi:diguanylate cyclase (GGDEF)-like protein
MAADINSILIAAAVLAAASILVGIGWVLGRRSAGVDRPSPPAEVAPPAARDADDVSDGAAVLAFTRDLFAAQSTDDVRAFLSTRLPSLFLTRRLWISGAVGGRRQIIRPDEATGPQRLTDDDFQEWTTLPLRAGRDAVGLIGIESATAQSARARRLMTTIAPFLGQALKNADTMDALREASLVDVLTGTASRREGLARLQAELKRAQRTGMSLAVLMLDLDQFKSINDRAGHVTGDAVLAAVGQTLRRTLRASDIRSRWGGEEFLVVLPDTDVERAKVVAAGLLRNIAAATVPTPEGPVGSTTSIGLTMTRPGETNVEAIIKRADDALYRAKHAGRGCVRIVLGDDGSGDAPKPPSPIEGTTLPFPDRRNPNRPDRRRVPSPGRRATDPRP